MTLPESGECRMSVRFMVFAVPFRKVKKNQSNKMYPSGEGRDTVFLLPKPSDPCYTLSVGES